MRKKSSPPPRGTRRTKRPTTAELREGAGARAAQVVALGLGSNQGNSELILRLALARLAPLVQELRVGSLYRARPSSPLPQPPYLNTAAVGRTFLAADELLACAKALERLAGRRRGPRLGPRPLDIDLLLHGGGTVRSPGLTLPHPRLRTRRFVLAPLADVAPGLRVPPDGATVARLLAEVGQHDEVEEVAWTDSPPLAAASNDASA